MTDQLSYSRTHTPTGVIREVIDCLLRSSPPPKKIQNLANHGFGRKGLSGCEIMKKQSAFSPVNKQG